MRALVTGATGFIGAALCRGLLAAGYSVRALRRPTSNMRLLEDLPVERVEGDLTQPESLDAAMQDVQVVFHAAAMLGDDHDAGRLYAVTVEGSRSVFLAARQAGVQRVVLTSSAAALGVPQGGPLAGTVRSGMDENHTWNFPPQSWPYAYAKYLSELEAQRAVAAGLDVVIVNPTLVMGAGDIYRHNSSLVVQVAQRRLPALVEGGLNVVHAADVTAGHLAALERGRCGERYLLAGENLTLVELVKKIAAVAGVEPPGVVLPAGVARRLALPARWFSQYLTLHSAVLALRMAGQLFYVDGRKASVELRLGPPRPADEAIREAYDYFVSVGAISARAAGR